jgi:hypothetical protein
MTMDADRARLYETEIARLDQMYKELEVLWTKVPRYGYLALLAPVVWYTSGLGWAITEVFVTGALMGTQAYLIGVRKSENRWTHRQLVNDLAELRDEMKRQN